MKTQPDGDSGAHAPTVSHGNQENSSQGQLDLVALDLDLHLDVDLRRDEGVEVSDDVRLPEKHFVQNVHTQLGPTKSRYVDIQGHSVSTAAEIKPDSGS